MLCASWPGPLLHLLTCDNFLYDMLSQSSFPETGPPLALVNRRGRGLGNVLLGPALALRPKPGNLGAKRGHFAGQSGFRNGGGHRRRCFLRGADSYHSNWTSQRGPVAGSMNRCQKKPKNLNSRC